MTDQLELTLIPRVISIVLLVGYLFCGVFKKDKVENGDNNGKGQDNFYTCK